MTSKITERYRSNGYFVAQAYLPAQEISDGVVTIAVVEGQYGKVTVRNQSNLSGDLISSQLDGINTGDPIAIAPLESRLLLLSDIPGVNVSSTLAPGASVGTSDLIVDVTPAQRVTGSIDADITAQPNQFRSPVQYIIVFASSLDPNPPMRGPDLGNGSQRDHR